MSSTINILSCLAVPSISIKCIYLLWRKHCRRGLKIIKVIFREVIYKLVENDKKFAKQ